MKHIYILVVAFFCFTNGLLAQNSSFKAKKNTLKNPAPLEVISAFDADENRVLDLNAYFENPGNSGPITYEVDSNSVDTVASVQIMEDTLLSINFLSAGQTNIHLKATVSGQTLTRKLIIGVQPRIEGDYLVSDFDNLALEPDSYWDGADGSGGFTSGVVKFGNNKSDWSWEGWAYSNISDNTTAGYENQFSAITGAGFDSSATHTNYGVGYISSDWNTYQPQPLWLTFNDKRSHEVKGLFITNSTYAALSMEHGDSFTKKFGGEDGSEPDYLKIFAWGHKNGETTDSVEFFLADYRFEDNRKDYIVKTWQWLDLSPLGEIDTLLFSIASSDVGDYGINTPTYFNIDNIYVVPNNSLVVAEPLPDVVAYVNDNSIELDISNVFLPQSSEIITELQSNSNPALVQASLQNQILTLSFGEDLFGSADIEVRAVLGTDTVIDVFHVEVLQRIDYSDGVFFVNEGWFGHDKGSVNFLKNNGEFVYRAFMRENPNSELGVTTSYGTIYGDNFYFVSKQAPRLVVADAKTLKVKAGIDEIGDADGRAFVGVTPQKGYISTSDGVYRFNIETLTVGNKIEGIEGQIGNITRANDYVFAVHKEKVFVIDAVSDTLIKTLGNGNFDGLAQSRDGKIWVGASGSLFQINPYTLDTVSVALPGGIKTPSTWAAWNANSLTSSATENAVYFAPDGGFNGSNEVYKYRIGDSSSLQAPFISLADTLVFSGAGIRINPGDNSMYIMARKNGWGTSYATNMVYRYDAATGEPLEHQPLDDYYWFPSMPVFPDNYAPQLTIGNLSVVNQQTLKVNLRDSISDRDNPVAAAVISGEILDGAGLADISIVNDTLNAAFLPGNMGVVTYRITVVSNGIPTSETIAIISLSSGAVADDLLRVTVYPNPANNQIRIEVPGAASFNVRLYNLSGNLVYTNPNYYSREEIDIATLPAGVYILKIGTAQANKVVRIVKQ